MIVEAFHTCLHQNSYIESKKHLNHGIYANPKERADVEIQILARAVRDSIKEQTQQAPHSPDP